jgi:Uma2 family endonuclease
VSPNFHHSILDSRLIIRIDGHISPRKLGFILPELRCSFHGESLVPDLCFIARGRIQKDERGRYAENVFLAPDLAIEILSPGQTVKHLTAKLTRCVAHGVRLAWLIQPRRHRVFVFRPGEPVQELGIGGVLDGFDVLPGFSLPLAEVFGWLIAED